MADKDFVVKNGLVVNNFLSVNATTIYVGNDVSNATVNTTVYTGTSNNTLYVGDTSAANVVSNNQLQSNLANYVRLDGLQSNIAKMHANSAQYLGAPTDTEGALYLYTNYARYTEPGIFSNNITINGNVVFANVNQSTLEPNYMVVVGNATFQNSVTITGSYLNTTSNSASFGTAVTIYANGNIGVVNTTPIDKLSVTGGGAFTGTLYVGDAVTFANTLSVTGSVTLSNSLSVSSLNVVTNSAAFGSAATIYANGNIGVGNTEPIDKISVTGNVAVSDTIKIGTRTINNTIYTGTANNANNLGGYPATDYVNAVSLSSNLSSFFKKDIVNEVTANSLFSANVAISNGIIFNSTGYIYASGSNGAPGQALLSNGTGLYWGSVNTSVIVAPYEAAGNTYIIYNNNGTMAANAAFKFDFSTNTVTIGTSAANVSINATSFSGTANNALNLGGSLAADYAKKADVHYIGTTSIALNRTSGAQTLTGVSIDGTAANATNLNNIAGSSYQLNSTLSANVATLTANNTSFVGSVSAADVVSNAQLTANLSTYTSNLRGSGGYAYAATRLYNGANPSSTFLVFANTQTAGTPTYVWGSSDGATWNAYQPANFSVSYATTAGSATSATTATSATSATSATTAGTATYLSATQQVNTILGKHAPMNMAQDGGATVGSFVARSNVAGNDSLAGMTFWQDSYAIKMGIRNDGYFGIGGWSRPAWSWYSSPNGDMVAAGNVIAYSDPRLKENFEKVKNALEIISKLDGGTFNWKQGIDHTAIKAGKRDYGVLADQVDAVMPEIVSESIEIDGEKYKMVAYEKLVPVLIEAIKELKAEIDTLKSK